MAIDEILLKEIRDIFFANENYSALYDPQHSMYKNNLMKSVLFKNLTAEINETNNKAYSGNVKIIINKA